LATGDPSPLAPHHPQTNTQASSTSNQSNFKQTPLVTLSRVVTFYPHNHLFDGNTTTATFIPAPKPIFKLNKRYWKNQAHWVVAKIGPDGLCLIPDLVQIWSRFGPDPVQTEVHGCPDQKIWTACPNMLPRF
jgi:hypothetical protein